MNIAYQTYCENGWKNRSRKIDETYIISNKIQQTKAFQIQTIKDARLNFKLVITIKICIISGERMIC